MKNVTVLLAAALLAGCATVSAPAPVTSEGPAPDKPAQQVQPPASATAALPKESEVCLKPDDPSGIEFRLYPPQSDATFKAKAGWTITYPAFQLIGAVVFPKPVDPASVKLRVDPAADWTYQAQPTIGAPDTTASFHFLPAGGNTAEPLNMQWGKPGWITLTVESAKSKDGTDLLVKPAALKIFAYSQEMQDTHPYLVTCHSRLEVSPGPNGP